MVQPKATTESITPYRLPKLHNGINVYLQAERPSPTNLRQMVIQLPEASSTESVPKTLCSI